MKLRHRRRLRAAGHGPVRSPHSPAPETDALAGDQQTRLPLPHERDESSPVTNPQPDPMIEQAGRDLESGQVDTDLRATPGLDATRRRTLLREFAAEGEARRRKAGSRNAG